jgi:hypothetical protein
MPARPDANPNTMFHKLTRQLKREISANKGKAAFLAVATVVAVYYWIPAIAGLLPAAGKQSAAAVDLAPVASATPTAGTDTKTTDAPLATINWQELMTAIHSEPLMQSAELPDRDGDPFMPLDGIQRSEDAENDQDDGGTVAADGNLTPGQLGMTLTSTLVGPRITVAKISGKTYSFPSDHAVAADRLTRKLIYRAERGDFEFDIVSARSGQLVLARGGQQFELSVSQPTLNDNEGIHFLTGNN